MAALNHCPQCGCNMPPDAPAGLCPDCLLGAGMGMSDPGVNDQPATEVRPRHPFVPPKPQDLANLFPQFEILDLLGHGGMGAVYKARQKSLDRLVALKIIKPDSADDVGFAERFAREAKALARLNYSAIVSVYDFGESEGLFFFVMEYVDGTNLRRLIESKELAAEQALQIIPQVCDALQFAHDEGIVHRDIKPENILVDSKGRVKIADFGLAKLLGQTALDDHTLTGTHQVMGTPRYMAPEQMEGLKSVDHRADIYSLGVVFYEMLTGELPMGSFEPPSRKVQVDVRLDDIVLRSLAKEPERRYQHASNVKIDVESISQDGANSNSIASAEVGGRSDQSRLETSLATSESLPKKLPGTGSFMNWAHLGWSMCIAIPILALIGFALWYTGNAWVLAALALPWFGVTADLGYYSEKPDEKEHENSANVVCLFLFIASVGLVAMAITVEKSAWPLFSILPIFGAAISGIWLGSVIGKDESTEDQTDIVDDETEAEEESPKENLEWAAWWIGVVGVIRSWALFTSGTKTLEKIVAGKSPALHDDLLVDITGPVMVLAAITMYHGRLYYLAVASAVLCLVSGNLAPLLLGLWSLLVLLDPKVRALFLANEGDLHSLGSARVDPNNVAKPPMPRGYGDAIGSTLGNAWTEWWRERDALFTRVVQTIILLLHIVCLLAFLGFSASRTLNDEGNSVFTHNIGVPSPWFSIQTMSGDQNFAFDYNVHWTTSAWAFAVAGMALAYMYCRVEKVRNPDITFWHKPEAFMLVWGFLALLDIGVGMGLGQLAINTKRGDDSPSTQIVKEGVTQPQSSDRELANDKLDEEETTSIDQREAAMHEACRLGDIGRVNELLDEGASVNEKDVAGQTLLMTAIANGNRSLALTLVVLGADLTEQDEQGRTALMYAVEAKDKVFLSRLRELQEITFEDDSDQRKSDLRAFSGVERTLLDGRDFDLRNVDVTSLEGQQDVEGSTASLVAARIGDWDLYAEVASTQDSLQARDAQGQTIAMYAAIYGHLDWFEPLTKPPFFGIADATNLYVGEMVPFDVAQLAVTDNDGKTAFELAEENGHTEIAKSLRSHLQAIIDNQTAEIEAENEPLADRRNWRDLARQALGENESVASEAAKEDGSSD